MHSWRSFDCARFARSAQDDNTARNFQDTTRVASAEPSVPVWVRVTLVVLAEQVLSVVVAIRRAHDRVDVIACWHAARHAWKGHWILVIELHQDHGTLDSVIEDASRDSATDPGEPRV